MALFVGLACRLPVRRGGKASSCQSHRMQRLLLLQHKSSPCGVCFHPAAGASCCCCRDFRAAAACAFSPFVKEGTAADGVTAAAAAANGCAVRCASGSARHVEIDIRTNALRCLAGPISASLCDRCGSISRFQRWELSGLIQPLGKRYQLSKFYSLALVSYPPDSACFWARSGPPCAGTVPPFAALSKQ